MPIKGLSERRRLPRLGKIHLGIKKLSQSGKEYPSAVDYFVLPREADGQLSSLGKQIADIYGEKPRELDIIFPVEDIEQIFPQSYKNYRLGVGLWCKGDGETASRVNEQQTMDEIPCPGQECPFFKEKNCSAKANLMFMLPMVGLGGVFQIDTSSINSIIDINSGIDMVRTVVNRISLVPLKLRVGPRQTMVGGKKKIVFTMTLALATFEEAKTMRGQLDNLRSLVSGDQPIALPNPQQDKFEETHLIPQSVQTGAPEVLPPEGATSEVDLETGEVVDVDFDIDDEPNPAPTPQVRSPKSQSGNLFVPKKAVAKDTKAQPKLAKPDKPARPASQW